MLDGSLQFSLKKKLSIESDCESVEDNPEWSDLTYFLSVEADDDSSSYMESIHVGLQFKTSPAK
jgi:hypothetical protein